MSALKEIRDRFAPVLAEFTDDTASALSMIRPSQDPKFGDYQANCAMPLAKKVGQAPREVAQRLVDAVDLSDLCEPPEIAGPGFINLRMRDDWLEKKARSLVADERLGHRRTNKPKTYVIDYSSPNVAKPMHVGHLRSSVIGAAIDRILRFAGHNVITDNHIGDWGTQFGMIIYGYKNFLEREDYERDPVTELARLYRLVNQVSDYHAAVPRLPEVKKELADVEKQIADLEASNEDAKKKKQALKKLRSAIEKLRETEDSLSGQIEAVESSPVLKELAAEHTGIAVAARTETAKLHAGDEENRRLWDEFLPECLKALDAVYDKLRVTFDRTLGESFYQPMLADVVQNLTESGLATESDGAICVFHEGNDAPFIVRKTDGAYTYATTDLATIEYRVRELNADVMLYVVDTRQSEHFQLLFETARKWGYDGAGFHHVNFGTVLGKDKRPFRTRSGDNIGLEHLLDEAVARAYEIVSANDDAKDPEKGGPELDEPTRRSVANSVGIGGIKYADLHHNRESDYVFDWDKMLATTGDTATYIQYANARIHGILRKGGVDRTSLQVEGKHLKPQHPSERRLALQLQTFEEVIDSIARAFRPHLLTQFLYETADRLSAFYRDCPVLKAEDSSVRLSRLLLCDLTSRTFELGLELLGIDAPQKM